MRLNVPLGALREREFRLFFSGQLVSLLGDAVAPFALIWAVLDFTGSASDVGYVLAAKTAPLVVFLLAGGVFADRLPRRAVMLTADVVRMCTQGGVAALLLTHHARIWELIVLQAIAGTASAFFNPASTGLTPMTVSAGHLQEANALRGISMASMSLVGPALAGVLIVGVGPGYAIAVDAASFAVSAVFLSQLHLPAHIRLASQSFLRDLRDGWHEFTARTWVWVITLGASLGNMMGGVTYVLAAAWVKGHGGAAGWTAILVAQGVGGLVGGAAALRVRPRRPMLFATWCIAPLSAAPAVVALHAPYWGIAGVFVVTGCGNMLFNTIWETTLQQHVPPQSLSRVSSYDWFGSLLCQPIGIAAAGPVAVAVGMSPALVIAAGVYAATLLMQLATRDVREVSSLERFEEAQLQQLA